MAKASNPFLKSANEQHEYTPDHMAELEKCSEDPVYFIQNYCIIQHPVKGPVPFELYDYQIEMIRAFEKNRQCIVLSARQTGKCYTKPTVVKLLKRSKIGVLKRFILFLLDKKQYDIIYNKSQ